MPNPATKETVGVDVDDVLVPHAEELIRLYNQKYGTRLTLADNHNLDPRAWGVNEITEAVKRVQAITHTPEFIEMEPYEDALTSLRVLSTTYEIAVITARDTVIEQASRDWLNKHFSEIVRQAHFTARYNLEGKYRSKAEIVKTIGAICLIDDAPENALQVAEIGVDVLLFGDYPWNQKQPMPANVTRVSNWQEVLEYFDGRN